jgi:tRNA threonylcarbamoyladenosine biosynthesis protein TsaB
VYAAAFARGADAQSALSRETVSRPEAVALPDGDGGWAGVGTGFAAGEGALRERLGARLSFVDATALPHAADVARLGAAVLARGGALAPERLEPAYLRDNVALTLAEQQALRESR